MYELDNNNNKHEHNIDQLRAKLHTNMVLQLVLLKHFLSTNLVSGPLVKHELNAIFWPGPWCDLER